MSLKWLLVIVLLPSLAFASENCDTQYKGVCRDICAAEEEPAEGAFIDCTEKQECCVAKAVPTKPRGAGSGAVTVDPQKKGQQSK
ncbi:MAG: hypothetical protein C0402_03740 [Thermodesulfovibrio sp.]|nr:hypothetical protein [Thermodesulfovibrio sp.]